uniref:Glycine rich superfamily member n=1 Tax=Rhipicephalus appendiculatus TaxID=34631 RepID=A0A131YAD6_RHIAP
MNAALVAGLVITSLLAGCEGQAAIKGQNAMYPPGPGTKGGGGYFPGGGGGGGYMPGAKGGMKGGGYKGFQPQQPQFPMMPQQPQFPPMGPPQRPMNPGQEPFFG